MAHVSDLIAEDIEQYLKAHEHKSLLRFLTCGSVDDGKSTLIGRLLYDSKMLFEDQMEALEADSKKVGTQGGELDFALLVDGLAAEREQGITIDVAYRFFSTDRRKFIVADTPGHEQYTRNMVTGASTADVAVVMIDARRGVLTQSRRHSYLASLLGIRKVVLAVNKMDLMDYSEKVYNAIVDDYRAFAKQIGLQDFTAIPMSALRGENITEQSEHMPWYRGTTLMGYLETVEIDEAHQQKLSFRMPVQWVNRPNLDFRGFTGTIASGVIRPGDRVRVLPGGQESRISRIVTLDGDLQQAVAGQSITLTLTEEVDCSRGDVLSTAEDPTSVADQFQVSLIWMHEQAMLAGRPYLMKIGGKTLPVTLSMPKYKVNVNTMEHLAAKELALNEIGVCNLFTSQPIAFDPYKDNRETGSFILIDRLTNATVGAGLIEYLPAPFAEHSYAARGCEQESARRTDGPAARAAVVHRFVGRRQVGHRQPAGNPTVRPRPAHLLARRRQRAPRPEPRPGLHRCRPGGKHPPGGRGVQVVRGCRDDCIDGLHLAVPFRARDGARAAAGRRVHRDFRRHAAGRGRRA